MLSRMHRQCQHAGRYPTGPQIAACFAIMTCKHCVHVSRRWCGQEGLAIWRSHWQGQPSKAREPAWVTGRDCSAGEDARRSKHVLTCGMGRRQAHLPCPLRRLGPFRREPGGPKGSSVCAMRDGEVESCLVLLSRFLARFLSPRPLN